MPGDLDAAAGEERMELAGYVLCVQPDGNATVLSPAGRTVSVRSLPDDPDVSTAVWAGGIGVGGVAKSSATINLGSL